VSFLLRGFVCIPRSLNKSFFMKKLLVAKLTISVSGNKINTTFNNINTTFNDINTTFDKHLLFFPSYHYLYLYFFFYNITCDIFCKSTAKSTITFAPSLNACEIRNAYFLKIIVYYYYYYYYYYYILLLLSCIYFPLNFFSTFSSYHMYSFFSFHYLFIHLSLLLSTR